MSVTIRNTVGTLADLQLTDRTIMRDVGLLVRERIVRRTLAGQDVEGHAFRPYSKGYRDWKAEHGGAGTVNLQLSGRMLNDIAVTATDDSATIDFKT